MLLWNYTMGFHSVLFGTGIGPGDSKIKVLNRFVKMYISLVLELQLFFRCNGIMFIIINSKYSESN